MTDNDDNWTGLDEARLARLLRAVPPAAPDPAARARAFEVVQAAWRETRQRRARRVARVRWFAAASVATLAIAGALWWLPSGSPQIASLERADGVVSAAGERVADGAGLQRGTPVATAADSGALLRYSSDLTLRLDADTRVTLRAADALQLEAGRVYVAVAPGADVPFVVRTQAGDVRHLGTRYAVAVRDDGFTVAVRDGAVEVGAGSHAERAVAGELLRIAADGSVTRSTLDAGDPRWAWADRLTAPIVIEGRPLSEFLHWYAAETGRRIEYADDRARTRAATAILWTVCRQRSRCPF